MLNPTTELAPDGQPWNLHTLRNDAGMTVTVMDWGATLLSARVTLADGRAALDGGVFDTASDRHLSRTELELDEDRMHVHDCLDHLPVRPDRPLPPSEVGGSFAAARSPIT